MLGELLLLLGGQFPGRIERPAHLLGFAEVRFHFGPSRFHPLVVVLQSHRFAVVLVLLPIQPRPQHGQRRLLTLDLPGAHGELGDAVVQFGFRSEQSLRLQLRLLLFDRGQRELLFQFPGVPDDLPVPRLDRFGTGVEFALALFQLGLPTIESEQIGSVPVLRRIQGQPILRNFLLALGDDGFPFAQARFGFLPALLGPLPFRFVSLALAGRLAALALQRFPLAVELAEPGSERVPLRVGFRLARLESLQIRGELHAAAIGFGLPFREFFPELTFEFPPAAQQFGFALCDLPANLFLDGGTPLFIGECESLLLRRDVDFGLLLVLLERRGGAAEVGLVEFQLLAAFLKLPEQPFANRVELRADPLQLRLLPLHTLFAQGHVLLATPRFRAAVHAVLHLSVFDFQFLPAAVPSHTIRLQFLRLFPQSRPLGRDGIALTPHRLDHRVQGDERRTERSRGGEIERDVGRADGNAIARLQRQRGHAIQRGRIVQDRERGGESAQRDPGGIVEELTHDGGEVRPGQSDIATLGAADEKLAAGEGVADRTGSTDADIEARGGPVGRGGRGHGRCQRGQGGHHGVEVEFLSGSFPVGDWNPIRNRKQVRFRNPQSEMGRA